MPGTEPSRALLRWLLRELSTDHEDMIGFASSLADGDDDDAQAFLDELAAPATHGLTGPLRAEYQDGKQFLGPREALRALELSRASFYAPVKRGTFPTPILIDDTWRGWSRSLVLEWADASERQKAPRTSHPGYAPFERRVWRNTAAD
jgi:predicted DNA-binding transcriptional regulator AlpA